MHLAVFALCISAQSRSVATMLTSPMIPPSSSSSRTIRPRQTSLMLSRSQWPSSSLATRSLNVRTVQFAGTFRSFLLSWSLNGVATAMRSTSCAC